MSLAQLEVVQNELERKGFLTCLRLPLFLNRIILFGFRNRDRHLNAFSADFVVKY